MEKIRDRLYYSGLKKEEYLEILPIIVQRNLYTLKFLSVMVMLFGAVFFVVNLLVGSSQLIPYAFLTLGGGIVLLLRAILPRDNKHLGMLLSYLQIILVFAYGIMLSLQPANLSIPATSIVVFLALLPLAVIDRPLRMITVVALFSAVYLLCSHAMKTPAAFRTDAMNIVAFSAMGIILYLVIINRIVREISQSRRVEKLQKDVIASMAAIIEERDESTGGHIHRTEVYVRSLLDEMEKTHEYPILTPEYRENVLRATPMHDIGKIKIPDSILNKPARLTPEEYEIIKKHVQYGADILDRTLHSVEEDDYYEIAHNIALYHHERYDGLGYPDGLRGEDIPLEARIMALADVYDALVSRRVYKEAIPKEQAMEIIRSVSGTCFDPKLTQLFLKAIA